MTAPLFTARRNRQEGMNMQIVHGFVSDGRCFVACNGDDITRDFICHAFSAGGKIFHVRAYEVANSFSDHLQVMMEICGTELPPLGEARVLC